MMWYKMATGKGKAAEEVLWVFSERNCKPLSDLNTVFDTEKWQVKWCYGELRLAAGCG